MGRTWGNSLALVVTSFALFVSIGVLAVNVEIWRAYNSALHLGYEGSALQVVALAAAEPEARIHYLADELELSVAYQGQYGTGIATISDPYGNFTNSGTPLFPTKSNEPWFALSVAAEPHGSVIAHAFPPGMHPVAADTVPRHLDLSFEGTHVFVSPEIQPFGSGIYLFAGSALADPEVLDEVLNHLAKGGLDVVEAVPLEDITTLSGLISRNVRPITETVYKLFFTVMLLSLGTASRLRTRTLNSEVIVRATVGADRSRLRKFALLKLLREAICGGLLATAVLIAFFISTNTYTYVDIVASLLHVLIVFIGMAAVIFGFVWVAVNMELRKVGRSYPI